MISLCQTHRKLVVFLLKTVLPALPRSFLKPLKRIVLIYVLLLKVLAVDMFADMYTDSPVMFFQVLLRLKQYKDDLLASCLTFVLSVPAEIAVVHITGLVSAVQVLYHNLFLIFIA